MLAFTLCGTTSLLVRILWSILGLLDYGKNLVKDSLLYNTYTYPVMHAVLLVLTEGAPLAYFAVVMTIARKQKNESIRYA